MDEYIMRKDAIEEVNGLIDSMSVCISKNTRLWIQNIKNKTLCVLSYLPAADVRENVHSEWVSVCGLYHCKNCGCMAPYDVEADVIMYWPELNYCPRCGADMRGVK